MSRDTIFNYSVFEHSCYMIKRHDFRCKYLFYSTRAYFFLFFFLLQFTFFLSWSERHYFFIKDHIKIYLLHFFMLMKCKNLGRHSKGKSLEKYIMKKGREKKSISLIKYAFLSLSAFFLFFFFLLPDEKFLLLLPQSLGLVLVWGRGNDTQRQRKMKTRKSVFTWARKRKSHFLVSSSLISLW